MKQAVIKSRVKERKAKGFSTGELVEAKVAWTDLNRMEIRVDPRRKTVIPKNVKTLKDIKKELKPVKPKDKPKKAETTKTEVKTPEVKK